MIWGWETVVMIAGIAVVAAIGFEYAQKMAHF